MGYNLPVSYYVPSLTGLMFIIMGSYMHKIKPNWFMGIRTPWTLSNEVVWEKTHVFGGKIFVVAGFMLIIEPFLPIKLRTPFFIVFIALILLGTVGYSYFVYLKEEKKKN